MDDFEKRKKQYAMGGDDMWTPAELKTVEPDYSQMWQFKNSVYEGAISAYLGCVYNYFAKIPTIAHLTQEQQRLDLDTVCGLELFHMKRAF